MLWTLLVACGPVETPDDERPSWDTAAAEDTGAAEVPAFDAVFVLLEERCGACHYSPYLGQFIEPEDPAASHTLLLSAQPQQGAETRYVRPGDTAGSLLLEKLQDDPSLGGPMPPLDATEERLDAEEIDLLRAWVAGGAPGP